MSVQALHLYAGPRAFAHIERNGLRSQDVGVIAGAAGGPKGLILGALDRFIFGDWLPRSAQPVHLVGASIGAWRMATACLSDPVLALQQLEDDYIHQHYELQPGQKRPTADFVSARFGLSLQHFFGGRERELLSHPRYRLHLITSRGRGLLRQERPWLTPLGYASAFVANALSRRALGAWLERAVFSSPESLRAAAPCAALPFGVHDYPTQQWALTPQNFCSALQASCSIPFALRSVADISGAPRGAYWDGGITDYHLHLDYARPSRLGIAPEPTRAVAQGDAGSPGLVLYPHFQRAVIPGWLDKGLPWRHRTSAFLDTTVLLAPNPDWVKTLPNGKLPDRSDFLRYGDDLAARVRAWRGAAAASAQLADEFQAWLHDGNRLGAAALRRL